MATTQAYKRLTKEYMAIQKNPPPFINAKPIENNILDWYYIITGPPDSPYEGGEYYGRITFPAEYPFKPPAIRMITPSGRFQPDARLCLTMSDFHPSSWNPSWSVATILNGLLSFMVGDEATTGSIKTSKEEKKIRASQSHLWNIKQKKFRDVFPELTSVVKSIQIRSTDDSGIIKRNNIKTNSSNNATNTESSQQNPVTRTISQGKRWIFVLVVFVYLILSKLIARSTSTTS